MYGFNLYLDNIYLSGGTDASISSILIFISEVVMVYIVTRYLTLRSLKHN